MNSKKSKGLPIKTPFYYGWVIVLIAALGVFFSGPGQTYSISIFIDPYINEFGWTRSSISTSYSVATLMAGLLLFFVGQLVDKYGHRLTMFVVTVLLGLACFWNSAIMSPTMLFIGFFLLRLLGQGSMTLLPGTLVPQWFIEKRGRALSFMAIGGFISSAAFPPINSWIIYNWGWSEAWILWGILLIALFSPLVIYLIRNKPEDVGLLPDNASNTSPYENDNNIKVHIKEVNWTLKEAVNNRVFWLIIFCAAIPPLINTGITFHLISILGEQGIDPYTAAFVLSLMAIAGLLSTLVAGFVVERIKVHIVLVAFFIGQVILIILLLNTYTFTAAFIFGITWGIIIGFERIIFGIIWPNYFGRKHLGSIKGIAMMTTVTGSAFGPLPFAIAYDYLFGGYTEILMLIILLPIAGAVAATFAPAPSKDLK